MSKIKSYHLITTTEGCATNLLENATYRKTLENSGLEWRQAPNDADAIIVNTCGYTSDQEEKSRTLIRDLKKNYPSKKIVVGGCLTEMGENKLQGIHKEKTFSPGNVPQLLKLLDLEHNHTEEANFFDKNDFTDLTWVHKLVLWARPKFFSFEKLLNKKFQPLHNILESSIINESYYTISVSQGCAGKCSFCSIKMAKGHVKSKPILQIMHEFQTGLSKGYKKFWLLGDDIGCYGVDINTSISILLKEILKLNNQFELIINYFEPYFLIEQFDQLKTILSDERIININFPLQSGNPQIVKRMGREYDPQEAYRKLKDIKKINPRLVLKTNIIVGFPGETHAQFIDSVRALNVFDSIYAIKFTPREGTGAAKYKDQIHEKDKKIRLFYINLFILFRHTIVALNSFIYRKNKLSKVFS